MLSLSEKTTYENDIPNENTKLLSNWEFDISRDIVKNNFESPLLEVITASQTNITIWTFDTDANKHINNDIKLLENLQKKDSL